MRFFDKSGVMGELFFDDVVVFSFFDEWKNMASLIFATTSRLMMPMIIFCSSTETQKQAPPPETQKQAPPPETQKHVIGMVIFLFFKFQNMQVFCIFRKCNFQKMQKGFASLTLFFDRYVKHNLFFDMVRISRFLTLFFDKYIINFFRQIVW